MYDLLVDIRHQGVISSTMIVLGAFQNSFKVQIQTRITFNNDTITLYRCKMSPKLEGLYRKDF